MLKKILIAPNNQHHCSITYQLPYVCFTSQINSLLYSARKTKLEQRKDGKGKQQRPARPAIKKSFKNEFA